MFQQEEAKREAGTGEDWCHPSAYNRRLRATQSPNNDEFIPLLRWFFFLFYQQWRRSRNVDVSPAFSTFCLAECHHSDHLVVNIPHPVV